MSKVAPFISQWLISRGSDEAEAILSQYLSFRTGQYGVCKFLFTEIFEFSIQAIFLFTTCNKRVSTDIIMSTTLLSLNLVSTPACLLANVRKEVPLLLDTLIDAVYLVSIARCSMQTSFQTANWCAHECFGVYLPVRDCDPSCAYHINDAGSAEDG